MVATLRMKNENYSSYVKGKINSSFYILHSSFFKKFVNQVLAMESS